MPLQGLATTRTGPFSPLPVLRTGQPVAAEGAARRRYAKDYGLLPQASLDVPRKAADVTLTARNVT